MVPRLSAAALQTGKPVIVASQLLNSMIDVPVPTRAEVADCADAVRQQADALMLSAETAAGQYPVKCVETLRNVRLPPFPLLSLGDIAGGVGCTAGIAQCHSVRV